jgi:CRP-like cAMP-binding protein
MGKSFQVENIPLFQGLATEDIELLSGKFEPNSFAKDRVIFNQGDKADRLYILLSGKVAIRFKPYDGEIITVADINVGDVFGWSAALGRAFYTSCAVTIAESEVLSIRGEALRNLCLSHPETGVIILERLAEVIAERLRNTHQKVVELLWHGVNSPGEK